MPRYGHAARDFSKALGRFLATQERGALFQAWGMLAYVSHFFHAHAHEYPSLIEARDLEALRFLNRVNSAPVLACAICHPNE